MGWGWFRAQSSDMGTVARLPWGSEEFRAGWAKNLGTDVMIANRMHNRDQPLGWSDTEYLTIVDNEERMTAELILPNTTAGRDAAEELSPKRRMLRGLSLEFITTKDDTDYRDHRVVMEGRMFGFGVVDKPAYGESLVKMKQVGGVPVALRAGFAPRSMARLHNGRG